MPRTVSQARSVFDRPAPRASFIEPVCSAVAFALLLASWAVAYVVVAPPDPIRHHAVQVAQVAR